MTPAVKSNGVPLVNADGTPALCKPGGCCDGGPGEICSWEKLRDRIITAHVTGSVGANNPDEEECCDSLSNVNEVYENPRGSGILLEDYIRYTKIGYSSRLIDATVCDPVPWLGRYYIEFKCELGSLRIQLSIEYFVWSGISIVTRHSIIGRLYTRLPEEAVETVYIMSTYGGFPNSQCEPIGEWEIIANAGM